MAVALGAAWGCGGDAPQTAAPAASPEPGDATGSTQPSPEIADQLRIDALLSERAGKVVAVNVWATWSLPCRKEFVELESLYQATSKRGFEILAIGVDDPAMLGSEVARFLEKTQPTFKVVLRAPGPDGPLKARLDPLWQGEIPTTFVFDRAGRLVARLNGAQTRASVEAVVDTLLGS